jgi:hypothetical protein
MSTTVPLGGGLGHQAADHTSSPTQVGEPTILAGGVQEQLGHTSIVLTYTLIDNRWGRRPAPSTLHRIRATLRSALNVAIGEEELVRTATRLPGERRTVLWMVRQAAHEGLHHLHDITTISEGGPWTGERSERLLCTADRGPSRGGDV